MNYFTVPVRVLQDMLADRTRRRVSSQEVTALCTDLAQIVRQKYEPNLVVAIKTGGSTPGELIAQALSIPVTYLTVRRNIRIARRYSLDPIPLRWIMSMYHHFLFQTTRPSVSEEATFDVADKKILIAEDTIHTGMTVDVAIEHLRRAGAQDVKVASLAYVSARTPDFSVLPRGNYSFPWSEDYSGEA